MVKGAIRCAPIRTENSREPHAAIYSINPPWNTVVLLTALSFFCLLLYICPARTYEQWDHFIQDANPIQHMYFLLSLAVSFPNGPSMSYASNFFIRYASELFSLGGPETKYTFRIVGQSNISV